MGWDGMGWDGMGWGGFVKGIFGCRYCFFVFCFFLIIVFVLSKYGCLCFFLCFFFCIFIVIWGICVFFSSFQFVNLLGSLFFYFFFSFVFSLISPDSVRATIRTAGGEGRWDGVDRGLWVVGLGVIFFLSFSFCVFLGSSEGVVVI
ncbi:hypothetical protein BZA05DRAFT_382169 [Tricharina praecox]|uniref:uncharacterized protein n=1 Tax=Tricharina praecox TaxID=43433 RepID=UPI00221FA458|nr:uncharacterized protein BZA05DRAFT_382169 [Tricharina praecox]KAI5858693.1 hypothetical protein BZA05DRAFT_382169 [Tricharina praecox]